MPRVDTTEGKIAMYESLQALKPQIEAQKQGLPMPAQDIFDSLVPLRPANWWEETYLIQLRQLSMSMYLVSFYQRKEADYAHKGDMAEARKYSAQVHTNMVVVKHLQGLLQLTPTQVKGESRKHLGATEISTEIHAVDDLEDGMSLYSH
jgi:hypothetical protein